jgi:ketosteroid isomerase-like protein
VIIRQAPDLPFSRDGDWTGHAGVLAFMEAFAETWHSMEVLAQHVIGDHETVVVLLDVRFVSAATRRSLTTSIAQVNTIKAGRIAEIKPYYWEPAAVQRVCDATQAAG